MNSAHIHLIINHIPLLTIPMALVFLVYALYRNDTGLKRFSLLVLVATAATVLPVYLTGEPAEKVIEHLPGVTEQAIEAHEEAAEFSLIVTLVGGALAAATLVFANNEKLKRLLPTAVVLTCVVATGSLGYTANLGGKIRHQEASDSTFKKSVEASKADSNEKLESGDHDND